MRAKVIIVRRIASNTTLHLQYSKTAAFNHIQIVQTNYFCFEAKLFFQYENFENLILKNTDKKNSFSKKSRLS